MITQDQLDLCRLALVIARMQLKTMAATAVAIERSEAASGFQALEAQMSDLASKIFNGELRGSDAGAA